MWFVYYVYYVYSYYMWFGPELPLNYLCPWQPAIFDTRSAVNLDVKAGRIKNAYYEEWFIQ